MLRFSRVRAFRVRAFTSELHILLSSVIFQPFVPCGAANVGVDDFLKIFEMPGSFFVPKHRGEKVADLFKFYHGAVKILPRCRKSCTTVP